MKTANSISGGKTSAFIAAKYPADYNIFSLVCIDDPECRPEDPALTKYVNTKLEKFVDRYGEFIATAEDDRTIRAMLELEQFLGSEIIWVRGQSFDKVIDGEWSGIFGGSASLLPNKHYRYCTQEMKLLPIFEWWHNYIGERINMRIGFRFDEYNRMERFMNAVPNELRVPVSCSFEPLSPQLFDTGVTFSSRQAWQSFVWRYCTFPLIKAAIVNDDVKQFWNGKIDFPEISNCVHCFWKKVETLAIMANMHPAKMNWAARQEEKGRGTWLPSKLKYQTIIANSENWIPEMIKQGSGCDSGGCHD